MRAAVLTVSDGVHSGEREDASGDLLEGLLREDGFDVVRRVVPDERETIAVAIAELSDDSLLVLTTGGTGFAPRDVTPEATASVIEREAPGIAEAIRRVSDGDDRGFGMLSRGVAGIRGRALICNLPGSSGGAREGVDVLLPIAAHALDLLAGGHPH